MDEMNWERLVKNIIDQVKEAQIKLGYIKESMQLYYPVESLYAILGICNQEMVDGVPVLLKKLEKKAGREASVFGRIHFKEQAGRVEIRIPPEMVEYVHQEVEEPAFLTEIITLFQTNHHCTEEDIRHVFEAYSPDYICGKMPEESDFDSVFYFKNGIPDEYFYCVKEEMEHTIYHRFAKEDYLRF